MTAQIVEIAGQKMAVLPAADYEKLLDIVEDKADAIAAFEAEQRRRSGEEYMPAEFIDAIIAGESPLRMWRKHRGLSQAELASRTGRDVATISRLERGSRLGTVELWFALADALEVTVEDLRTPE
jgi:DNA-binding XRE family transcriptional regulator